MVTFRNPHPALVRKWFGCLLLVLLVGACGHRAPPPPLRGTTMGTVYTVRVAALPDGSSLPELQRLVDRELDAVNRSMSTYDPESEVSRFNRDQSGDWFPVSPALATVVAAAQTIARQTGGAFDTTVGPLVEAWGFGAAGRRDAPPSAAAIAAARAVTGYKHVTVRMDPPALLKTRPGLAIDLSAIAKGYAVDRVAAALESAGVADYLVEIGGELRTAGQRPGGASWRVGIEQPNPGGRRIQRALPMHENGAIATSGDYRNFFEADGQRYAHIIDPRTGRPVDNTLASVTVIAPKCMTADGWATALSVLGLKQGIELARARDLAVLFIEHRGEEFDEHMTPAFADWLAAGTTARKETGKND
jgi:thiamine biosynthesis lipoprotein